MTLKGDKRDFMRLRCRLEKELGLRYHCLGEKKISYYQHFPIFMKYIPGVVIDEKDDKVICAFLLHFINTGEFKVEDFRVLKIKYGERHEFLPPPFRKQKGSRNLARAERGDEESG